MTVTAYPENGETIRTKDELVGGHSREFDADMERRMARAKKLVEKLKADPQFQESKEPGIAYIIVGHKPSV